MEQTQLLFGSRKAKASLAKLATEDEFSESPIFGHNVDEAKKQSEGNPFLKNWATNGTLAGIFRGIKTMKLKEGEKEPRRYIRMVTLEGVKFRAYAPGQLGHIADNLLRDGVYVELTYKGKTEEPVELKDGTKRSVHQYDVLVEQPLSN